MKKASLFVCPVIFTICMLIIYLMDPLTVINNTVRDLVFQRPQKPLENILVIGIDDKTLQEIGPWQTWSRSLIANMIKLLNKDPNNRPAVIGVNIMFFGATTPQEDLSLVEASDPDHTVFASQILNDDKVNSDNSGILYKDTLHVIGTELPFEQLAEVCSTGFTNTLLEEDGYVRNALLSINNNGIPEYNFAYQLYLKYAQNTGITSVNCPPVDSYGMWHIPYSAKPNTYGRGLSFLDVMNGKVSPETFKDAIVIIGPYASGMLESYYTPIDKRNTMYGSEISANMVQAFCQGNFKVDVSVYVQLGIAAFAILACYYLLKRANILISCLILFLFTLGYFGFTLAAYYFGYILDVIYIPAFALFLFGHRNTKNYLLETEQKKEILSTFKRYVAPQFVDDIMKQNRSRAVSAGIKRDIAVMFIDIRGFTTMSEDLPAESVVGILNEYFTLTSTMIFQNDGTLDKFIGDATMALFNAPLTQEDYVYKAVKTAHDIATNSALLEKSILEKYGKTVSFGIGINCGDAVIGNIGAEFRMDYTAIGDTVNIASRLESNAKAGQILISQPVYERLKGRITVEKIGEIALKGKAHSVIVYQLIEPFPPGS